MNNKPTVIDLDETPDCEMTAEEQKAFAEKIIAYVENDTEAGVLRIAIPKNALPEFTQGQRVEIITNSLAETLKEYLKKEINNKRRKNYS